MTRDKGRLILFTEKFPFIGGETFLETEILYLCRSFEKVIIFPLYRGDKYAMLLPKNAEVVLLPENKAQRFSSIVLRNARVLLAWFGYEFINSRHRFKYIRSFKWNLYRLLGLLQKAHQWRAWFAQNKYSDSVLYSYWFNEWGTVLALCKSMGMREHFISRVHLYDFEEAFSSRGYLPFRKKELKQVKAVYPISAYAQQYLKEKYPLTETALFRLGVEDHGENPVSTDEKVFTVVTCSSLTWYKRPLLLVEVMKNMSLPIKWIHFGDGEFRDAFLTAAAKLPDNVTLDFRGAVPNKAIIAYYQSSPVDLVLNVSEFEGIPVSLMEAISFGIPVAGCDVCGMPEIVTSKTGVLLLKELDCKETADVLSLFLKTKSRNPDVRKVVKSFWKERFNAANNYQKFTNYLIKCD